MLSVARALPLTIVAVCLCVWAIPNAPAKEGDSLALPSAVLEFAKATKMGGEFVIEVDAAGKVVALEAEVDVSSVPKSAVDAAAKAFPDAKPVGAEKEWIAGRTYFEVVLERASGRVEFLVQEDGSEGGREEVIPTANVPKVVLDAADKAVPGGTVEVVEKVSGAESAGRGTEYHVKKRVNGELQRISVSPEGKVALVLRKLKAEFKLPR